MRTLFHRANAIVSDPQDLETEKSHLTQALKTCGYPQWGKNKGLCQETYIGETERSLKARFQEHTRPSSASSEVSQHIHTESPRHFVSLDTVHQEIDSVLGQSPPSYAQRNLLPYTAATIAEVQRIKPIVPLSVPHAASRDTTLNGYNIPQEAIILVNLWSVHMDPELFPEPDSFRPERFLDQDGNFAKHEALIPFSIGHRICLGEQLAKMELFMLFVSLMQRFTFHLPEGAPKPSMMGVAGGVMNVPPPFELCAVPRG
ncbi:hypothetical protein Bbelb_080200 [Branchiostoma belcheri]|nr:hypothetical protein Bbelb_080200 [Branchiostoma belcheri]